METIPKPPGGFATPEEELHYLRSVVQGHEALKNPEGVSPHEREKITQEVVHEYSTIPKEQVLAESHAMPEHETEALVLKLSPEPHDSKIEELYGLLVSKGLKNTLGVVAKLNDPHIDDDFHRFLVQYIHASEIPDVKRGSALEKSLRMKLFEVTLPTDIKEEKSFKELISGMEQFYAGMLAISEGKGNSEKAYFTLEIAEQNSNNNVVFYGAVPESKADLFEKQVLASFPNANVVEKMDDYNVFTPEGEHVGAYAELSSFDALPIRTYDKFDHDPLNGILTVFSKLKESGEGAAIQLVISPAGDRYIKKFTYDLKEVEKGEKLRKKSALFSDFDNSLFKIGKEFVTGKIGDKEKEKDQKKVDETVVKHINEKISHTLLAVNIRIIASAGNKVRASQIIRELESSFQQFSEPTGNSILFKEISERNAPEFFHDFSFRQLSDETILPLNLRELTSLYHFPWGINSSPDLKSKTAVEAPAPAEMGHTGVLLGMNRYRGKETPIYFDTEDRLRHFYVIGQTGTGKTVLLKNMIVQDIKEGRGVCFIDPHGSDIQEILAQIPKERIDDVIYFDPAYTPRPMGLNMLEFDPRFPEQKTFVVDEMLSIFRKLFGAVPESMGPAFEQYFRNSCLLVLEHPESGATILEIGRVMADKAFRDMKLAHCKNPIIHQFWTSAEKTSGEGALANYVPYITNKFDVFVTNEIMRPIIAQEKSAFNFREIMDQKKILLVNLSKGRLGEINANLIGLVIVGKILMSALSRVDSFGKDLPPFFLYIDEFQNVTTNSISQILSEARKYKLGLTIAHQFIAQLEEDIKDAVFGNVGSISAFRVGVDDAEFLEKQFAPIFTAQDLIKVKNWNAYMKMLVNGMPVKPFSMATMKPGKGVPEVVESVKELSYLKHGRDRAEVEEEIMARYRKVSV